MKNIFYKFMKKPNRCGKPMMPEKLMEAELAFAKCDKDCPIGNLVNELLNHIEWQAYNLKSKEDNYSK